MEINIYKKHGAKLINAHGTMLNNIKNVPANTVLMFLTNPGYCTALPLARQVYHNHFETRHNLEKFLKGNVKKNEIHVSNIRNRTHLPFDHYRNMTLTFNDKRFKSLAYVRKLPLTTQQYISEIPELNRNKPPTFAETAGPPIKRGTKTKLSDILKIVGPGVYIIASCRRTLQNKNLKRVPTNLSSIEGWPYEKPIHPTDPSLRRKLNTLKSKHPGSFNYQLRMARTSSFIPHYKRNIDKITQRVLEHMSKNNGRSPFKTYIAPLPANTNIDLFEKTRESLINRRLLPVKTRLLMRLTPSKKAQLAYNYFRTRA